MEGITNVDDFMEIVRIVRKFGMRSTFFVRPDILFEKG